MFGLGLLVGSIANICVSIVSCKIISKAIETIGKALGIIKVEDKIEDLGDRALQAEDEGITLDNFSTFEEYKEALEKFEIDPEKTKSNSMEAKERKFIEICAMGMKEQNPNLKVEEMLTFMDKYPNLFSPERANVIGKLVVEDSNVINDMVGFVTGNERNGHNLKNGRDALVTIEMDQNPNLTIEDAKQIVYNKRE